MAEQRINTEKMSGTSEHDKNNTNQTNDKAN